MVLFPDSIFPFLYSKTHLKASPDHSNSFFKNFREGNDDEGSPKILVHPNLRNGHGSHECRHFTERLPDMHFEATPEDVVEAMLKMAGVAKEDVVL